MKAIRIQPNTHSIESIEVSCLDDIVENIGFDTVISDDLAANGERLFFDENCFLRETTGRFQIDNIVPVSGVGIIIGASKNGTSISNVQSSIESVRERIKFLPNT